MMKIAPVRKVVRRSHMGFVGWFHSRKHGRVPYESHGERDMIRILEVDPDVTGLRAQPEWIRWWHDGTGHDHCPDFAFNHRGLPVIVEVKPAKKIEKPKTDNDFQIAIRTPIVTALLADRGITYRLLTERFIRRQPTFRNAMLLLQGIHCDPMTSDVEAVLRLLSMVPEGLPARSIAGKINKSEDFIYHVYAMIMDGHCRFQKTDAIFSANSVVVRSGEIQ